MSGSASNKYEANFPRTESGGSVGGGGAGGGGGSGGARRRRLLLLDFDGPICPLHRNTTAGNVTFKALGGRVCHERFSGDTVGQCHVEVSNYGAFECLFRVLHDFPDSTVLVGSQRLAGKYQSPNSMLFMSYHEMVFALKFIFPEFIGDAKIEMSDRISEGIDPVELNNTKLPFLLSANKLKVFSDLEPADICLLDDHPGYRAEIQANGFHFIHCLRQPQDECHRVAREDMRLVNPDGSLSAAQNMGHIPDGTKVRAKYPGRLYDKDAYYPAQVVRSKFNEREQKHIYVVQYVPERKTETGYIFEALRWLTVGVSDEELYDRLKRCGSPHAQVVASLFSIHCGLQPQLADMPRRGASQSTNSRASQAAAAGSAGARLRAASGNGTDVSCCAVM